MFGGRGNDNVGRNDPPRDGSPSGVSVVVPARTVEAPLGRSPAAAATVAAMAPPPPLPPPQARRHESSPSGTTGPRRGDSEPQRGSGRIDSGDRKLIVGRGLALSGEIAACDVLVVEGKVEAKLGEGKLLEITESGQFRGAVEIENADIAGRYDGQLTVHGRLLVRGTGRISGMVKYGELEVVAGGQIIGEVQVVGAAAPGVQQNPGNGLRDAAKFVTALEDDLMEETPAAARRAASGVI